MKIIPLSEGAFTVDKSKLFVPFNKAQDDLQQRNTGSLLVEVQPFAVITTEDIIILDTGLGFSQNGRMQIHQNLMAAGINPGEVTKVLMSHLHKDHAGGLGYPDGQSGKRKPAFPGARYYIQRKEFDYAREKGFPSYLWEDMAFLENDEGLVLLDGYGVIDGYIRYEMTGAHCPFHQVFWIVDGGETAFYGADVAPQLHQMKHRFVAKYDEDGRRCMELRKQWWEKGEKQHWTFLFYHDIKTPVWQF